MKKTLLFIACLLGVLSANADNLFIDDFSIDAGETKQVSINLNNSGNIVALQFEMYLPDGLTVAKDARGRLRCSVNSDRADDHTLTMGDRGNGQYNAAYYSANNYEIYENSGEIISVYITADEDFSGTATINLKEIYVSDAAGNMPQLSNSSCTVTGPQPVNPPTGATSISIDDFSIDAGETKQVSVNMHNESELVAFQLEVHLPNGLTVAKDTRNRLRCAVNADRADDHTITMGDRGNGQYNVAYYSANNYAILGNSGEVFNFWVTAADNFCGTATVELKEAYVSDATGNMTKLDDTSCTVTGPNTPQPSTATSIALDTQSCNMNETTKMLVCATIEPAEAADQALTWTSSDETVATVDNLGRIYAIKPGEATITATTTDGSNLSASCKIKVLLKGDMNDDYVIDIVDINGLLNIILGN